MSQLHAPAVWPFVAKFEVRVILNGHSIIHQPQLVCFMETEDV